MLAAKAAAAKAAKAAKVKAAAAAAKAKAAKAAQVAPHLTPGAQYNGVLGVLVMSGWPSPGRRRGVPPHLIL